MNFLRILSGTRYAALVPTRPRVRAGLLLRDDVGSTGGTAAPCAATGALCGGTNGPLFAIALGKIGRSERKTISG
jgi:hypothetical protein